jgi:hypothetical protein
MTIKVTRAGRTVPLAELERVVLCDMCHRSRGFPLTAADHARLPNLAPWLRLLCTVCRRQLEAKVRP